MSLGPTPRVILADPGCQVAQQPVGSSCITCGGTALCPDCGGTGGAEDVEPCIWCEGSGECRICRLDGRPVITIRPAGGVL